ncbi:limbic system-associated membrane protein-like, partial [Nothobranchius furzeri]
YVDEKVSKVAYTHTHTHTFAGQDKWSLDPTHTHTHTQQLEYSLRIQKVDVYDEGSYTCSIQTKQQPKTSQVYLIVQAEPLGGEEYLDVIGITRNQAGRYECKASNDVAMPDVKYVNVVVNYTPTIKKTQSSETPVGRMGMLQCEAVAMPTPEFEWYRDENRLSSNQGINIQILGMTTNLMFANVTEDDYGNYTCVASNRLGAQSASLYLYRPGTGWDISGSACVCESLWLLLASLTCLFFKC